MNKNSYTGKLRELIRPVKYHPSVSIIIPFEPHIRAKNDLAFQLKKALSDVEKQLYKEYTSDRALPVIIKLHKLLAGINYNNFKKSIAIFASPFVEKIIYLDFEVEQKIVVDDSFEMRDVVYCKKQVKEYLVLVLSACSSVLYIGNCHKLVRIKSNVSKVYNHDITESETDNKEILADKFLHKMDQELKIILNAYPFPVFVLGTEKINRHYKKITQNKYRINAYINGNYINTAEQDILKVLKPYTSQWNKIKQTDFLQQVDKAMNAGKLHKGIDDVWNTAAHKKGKLLLVENDFRCLALKVVDETVNTVETNLGNPFYIKDAVDDIIEKVLENGGDVEFLEKGSLSAYEQIILIE
jgi:hypothetical protein